MPDPLVQFEVSIVANARASLSKSIPFCGKLGKACFFGVGFPHAEVFESVLRLIFDSGLVENPSNP